VRLTWETLKLSFGFADDSIDREQHAVGKITRLLFPFLNYSLPPIALYINMIGQGWNGEWYNVTTADTVRDAYTMGTDFIDEEDFKSYGFRLLLGGNSPFLIKGAEHVKVRRALIPELAQERVEAHREMSVRVIDRMIDELPFNEPTSLTPLFTAFAQEMIIRFVFGLDDDDQSEIDRMRDCLRRCMAYSTERRSTALTTLLVVNALERAQKRQDGAPWVFRRARRLSEEADGLLYGKITELRAHPNDSVASRLIARSADDPEFWTEKRLRDMLATLLVAGHETSVSAYQWTLEYLLHNDKPRSRLIAEARRGESDSYARACSAEAVRLKPPLWAQMMHVRRDLALADYRIRRGALLFAVGSAVHSDPELYPDPLAFTPERWIGQKPDRFGYISFGAGKHRCPGTMFFGTEASIVFQRLFGRMDIDHFSTEFPKTRMAAAFLNRPAKPTKVYIRTRAAAKDVPCYQPADGIDQALDIPIDELVADGSEDNDDVLSSLNETSRPSCPVSGIAGGVAAASRRIDAG
jgi:cytochrome P450